MASYHRAALYVFFDAVENDLKNKIRYFCLTENNILNESERQKAIKRRDDSLFPENVEDFDIVDRLDLGEKYDIILRWKSKLPLQESKFFQDKNELFKSSIPVRNAIMHGRPLTVDEYARAFALIDELKRAPQYFPELVSSVLASEEDPRKFIASVSAIFDDSSFYGVFNNLPVPDYDDTGFFSRPQLEAELKRKILGRHPVITVLGDGGNGKTALTLQVLYGLLNSNDHGFDAIVWVSAKSSRLTITEVERIGNAISNSLELFNEVASVFENDVSDPRERVKILLENNKILLVIDNLETVLDDSIVDFASDIPGESKVVFTSRVPLGSDLSVNVGAFSEGEGISYLRALINAYGIDSLRKQKNEELKFFTSRLGNKPLLIKWFSLGVVAGLSPNNIVKNPVTALKFCMENIFESLSENAKSVVSVLIALPRPASLAVLQHVSSISAARIEMAIAELLKFSIVEDVKNNKYETNYQVKPFARAYAVRVLHVLGDVSTSEILSNYRSVEGALEAVRGQAHRDRYNIRSYTVRSKSEALTVIKIRQAVSLINREEYDDAFALLEEAKISNANYFEVYRAEAFALLKKGDFTNAKLSYESALDLAGDQPQLHFFYGGFLLRAYNDLSGALEALDKAYELDPNSIEVLRELARVSIYNYDYEKAHSLLSRWQSFGIKSSKEATKLADLEVQAYTRQIEFLMASSSGPDIAKAVSSFEAIFDCFDPAWLDGTLIEHLDRASAVLQRVDYSAFEVNVSPILEKIKKLIPSTSSGLKYGTLKEKGRQPNFGFLVDLDGNETFVPRATVQYHVWQGLLEGQAVTYELVQRDGKYQAANVQLYNGESQPAVTIEIQP